MNTPVPSSDRVISSSATNAVTLGTGAPSRGLSTTGASFAQVLSGLPKTGESPKTEESPKAVELSKAGAMAATAVAGAVSAKAAVTPSTGADPVIAAPVDRLSTDPAPAADPVTVPALPAMVPAMAANATAAPDIQDAAPQRPAQAAPAGKAAGKAAPSTVKHAAQPDPDTTPPLALLAAGTVVPQPPPPVRLGSAASVNVAAEHGQAAASPHGAPASVTAAIGPEAGKVAPDLGAAPSVAPATGSFMVPVADAAVQALVTLPMDMPVNGALLAGTAGVASAVPPTAVKPAASGGLPAAGPAAQLAPALVQIGRSAGSNHITVRLDPLELGSVAIRIDRGDSGTASVQVTVERPETLRLLLSDQPQLQRALDAAGLPQEGRTVTVTLATPEPSPAGGSSASAGGGGSSGANPGGGFGGQPGGRQGQRPSQTIPIAGIANSSSGWLRAGVDITA